MSLPTPFNPQLRCLHRDHESLRREADRVRLLLMARKFSPGQPRVPAGQPGGGQWTDGGGGLVKPAYVARAIIAAQKTIEAALALFAALSAYNSRNGRAIIAFNARDYRPGEDGGLALEGVSWLTQREVEEACEKYPDVQARTDRAVDEVRAMDVARTAQTFGTAVHLNLKDQIASLADPDYKAEVSILKGKGFDEQYGQKNSIRIDVLERAKNDTVCVYDIKTGSSGLPLRRSNEIAREVYHAFGPSPRRIIVTEVRPSR